MNKNVRQRRHEHYKITNKTIKIKIVDFVSESSTKLKVIQPVYYNYETEEIISQKEDE